MIIFGTKKLRSIGADLGGAVRGFKDGMKDGAADQSSGEASQAGRTIEARVEEKTKI